MSRATRIARSLAFCPFAEPVEPGALDRWLDVWPTEELAAARPLGGDFAARQESKMANADEPFGQHMEEEPSDKLVGRQPHHLGTIGIGIILQAERHLAVLQRQQTGIGKGHAVGIAAEIAKH